MKKIINVKRVIYIILIIVALILSTNVYAANDSFKTSLSVNKSQVKRGEKITVTMSLSDISIESGEKGIGAYTAKLDFDSSILEYVKDSARGAGKWETPLYQDSYITGNTNDGNVVNTNQSIGTFEFMVKDNAALGETTIKLVNFSGSTAQTDVSAANSSVKITVINNTDDGSEGGSGSSSGETSGGGGAAGSGNTAGGTQSGQNDKGKDKTNIATNTPTTTNNTANNATNNTKNNASKTENLKSNTLPKTGPSNFSLIYIICALFAIVCVIRIKMLNNKSKHSN